MSGSIRTRSAGISHPEVVCGVHRGLVAGVLGELGGALGVERLDAFTEADLCIFRLRRAAR